MRAFVLLLLSSWGCRTVPLTSAEVLRQLKEKPGAHLTGSVVELTTPQVFNREDFVWDARTSPDSRSLAFSRLGMKSFHLSVFGLDDSSKARADVEVNPLEFNVEALDWSPDGASIATVSRDHSVRLFDSTTGSLKGAWLTDEPLTAIAFHPKRPLLAVASTKGLITVLSFPDLSFVSELRAHTDEVTALAWASTEELFSSSWDRTVSVLTLGETSADTEPVRVRFEKKAGVTLFRAVLNGKASGSIVIDTRLPVTVIRSSLAQTLGIDPLALQDSLSVPTPLGAQLSRVFKGGTLSVKGLKLSNVDFAICDVCLPDNAQAALGQSFVDRVDLATDALTAEYVLSPKPGVSDVGRTASANLARVRRLSFEASVNDVSVDASGTVLGLALSEAKGERTKAVYDREKAKTDEPERPWDCAARVDAHTGRVIERLTGHLGVVSTVGVSPDGKTMVSGGWDKKVILHGATRSEVAKYGWAIRRVRFSRDGSLVSVAAWTPQNPLGDHQSDPSAVVYRVAYEGAAVAP